ncbi:MAG: 30S ribosomal protein S4e [Candidatus Micrarchaeota archaeon]
MAKKGETSHTKRLAIPKAIPIYNKKEYKFIMSTNPGTHPKAKAIPLGVLIRDVLCITKSASETRKVLNAKQVFVDNVIRKDERFPIGLMDLIFFPKVGKAYQIVLNTKGQLIPVETKHVNSKIGKIVKKHVIKKGKINITLHDGRNIIADNNICVGDSIIITVPEQKIDNILKFEKGAKCLVTEGKHIGSIANLESLVERKEGSGGQEAKLKGKEEFITAAKYLMVINEFYHDYSLLQSEDKTQTENKTQSENKGAS